MHIFAYIMYIKDNMSHSVHLWDCDVYMTETER